VRRPLASCALAAALALTAAPAAPQEDSAPRVRVVTEDFPPYNFEEQGAVKGAATEVVRAVLERAGLQRPIEVLPWRRALDSALNEPNTLIYSVARTEGREHQLAWLGRICDRRLVLYCLKERDDLIGHPLESLPDATFAVIQGDASEELLRRRGVPERNLRPFRDAGPPSAALHVLAGRSDFFVSNPLRLSYGQRGTALAGRFREHSVLWEGDGYYLAANPASDPALIGRVRDAFAALEGQGRLKTVFDAGLRKLSR